MNGVFVIGTDTGVGKSVVCAGILKMAVRTKPAVYWKPVQTGTIHGDDTNEIKLLTGLDLSCFEAPTFRFPEVLSPYMAAKKWGKTIELKPLVENIHQITSSGKFLVIEGAGGLLVPYHPQWKQIDLIKASKLPVLVVGRDKVGVINQALLTIEALRRESIPCLGIILTSSSGADSNSKVIEEFGKTPVLYTLPNKEDKNLLVADIERSDVLQKLFKSEHPTV